MIVVLNEWIFHDLLGENGEDDQRRTAAFLNAFRASNDKLVWPTDSHWVQKAYLLMRRSDVRLRSTAKQFHSLIRNSDRVLQVGMQRVDVPEELRGSLPADDAYLVEAYIAAGADVLVTTDHGLHEALSDSESVAWPTAR